MSDHQDQINHLYDHIEDRDVKIKQLEKDIDRFADIGQKILAVIEMNMRIEEGSGYYLELAKAIEEITK